MTLAELLPFLAQGGVVGVVVWAGIALHRSAVRAHGQRADDWRATAVAERAAHDETRRQLLHVLGAVKDVRPA